MRNWNQVKLEKAYLELATQNKGLSEHAQMRRDFLLYKKVLLELLYHLDNAQQWVDTGGEENVALNNLLKEAEKARKQLPGNQ